MGRSFSFSSAWEKNQRHIDRLERRGDPHEMELREVKDSEGRVIGRRMAYKTGSTLGFDKEDWNHKGAPIERWVGEETDYGDGTVSRDYTVRASNGRLETHRSTWEVAGDGTLVSRGSRRVYE